MTTETRLVPWHLASLNDGLFIVDKAPPAFPDMVLNVTDLHRAKARAIVDAHNAMLAAAPLSPTPVDDSAGADPVSKGGGAAQILKGVGKINGDGWKDTTRKGEVVFVWNAEKPKPYAPGLYPRIGNEGWSASTSQYDFTPATCDEIKDLFASLSPRGADAEPVAYGLRPKIIKALQKGVNRLRGRADSHVQADVRFMGEVLAEVSSLYTRPSPDVSALRERERIAKALDAEADGLPCEEDAKVMRGAARLVRANFTFNEAEEALSHNHPSPEDVRELEAQVEAARDSAAASDDALLAAQSDLADLQSSVIAFAAPWAAEYARMHDLPPGHLLPDHYDLLESCGARMDDFTRAALSQGEAS